MVQNSTNGANGALAVTLVDAPASPHNLAIAAARTCYSSSGIILPDQAAAKPELRDKIAQSTLKAGHLTTRQHGHFVFAIRNVSRHLAWSFLHSHPFYNSEQVSQRYVEVRPDQFYFPPSLQQNPTGMKIYREAVEFTMERYHALIEELKPAVRNEYYRIFPARGKRPEKYEKAIHKKAMEAARYLLPVSVLTYLYHTIDALTLHRYRRLCNSYDVPEESRRLVDAMVDAVRAKDPLYTEELHDPLPLEETLEYRFFAERENEGGTGDAARFVAGFDDELGTLRSRLVAFSSDGVSVAASSLRAILGVSRDALSDDEALAALLDPAKNSRIASVLNESTMTKMMRALYPLHYTFQKKISHTADSQDQRHRTVPGGRPVLMRHFSGNPDFITPRLIENVPAANDLYGDAMESLFRRIGDLIDAGCADEAVYLLPNAFPIRFYESGDLLNLHHKWKTRLCYDAQEEIFHASLEEVQQVASVHPQLARMIHAPCRIRSEAGITPPCPEGDRFCGVKVWKLDLEQYERTFI